MATDVIKLLGSWASPYTNRVQMALKLKSIEFEFIGEDLQNKSELLLKANPVHKQAPVLIHGDKPVCESLIIVQYIDDSWTNGRSLLPSDPYDRALARFWAAYLDDKWFPLLKKLGEATDEEARAAAVAKIFDGLAMLEETFVKCSKGKAFFSGDSIGYLDIAFGSYLGWVKASEIMTGIKWLDETKIPRLVGWVEKLSSDDVFKHSVPDALKLVELYTTSLANAKAASA